jgi:alkylation response protein AidB-like acyl-CoA dehydrogenase
MSIVEAGNRSEQERQAMEVAEEAREESWNHPSFCEELFAGNFNFNLIYPFPEQSAEDRKLGDELLEKTLHFLTKNLDPIAVDENKLIPENVMQGLKELGLFGIKIPKEYGGLGLSQTNYNRVIHAVGSYCASTAVLLSAHQSIGVPQPLKIFGTPEQKKKYLPRLAKGEVSAFALTELEVGSDPARMSTTATPSEDGKHFILNGTKLWTTNGTIADLFIVMAVTPPKIMPNGKEKKQISAFIVERNSPGLKILHRCDFMGLKGIQNGLIEFNQVKVPRENLLWAEGKGLKLALVTLNTGRLTLPAAVTGGARVCFEMARTWAKERKQWGSSIGDHESSAYRLLITAGGSYALDAISKLTSGMADRGGSDIRIEAAVAKLFSTGLSWRIIDQALQLRGGRGYETARSLKDRGEDAYPIEKLMRDSRINSIIEGTSDIQRLFVSREALDRHLKVAGALFNPKASIGEKLSAVTKAALFYSWWYPKLWLNFSLWPRFLWAGGWESRYLRYIHSMSRRLARTMFHAMVLNGPGLEKKQLALGRIVDTGSNLFVMATVLSRYITRKKSSSLNPKEDVVVRRVCASLKAATDSSYSKIKIWPGKSEVLGLSKAISNGELNWITEDLCDVVGLAKEHGQNIAQNPSGNRASA